MENMKTVANQVKDLAYDNGLQAGVIAQNEQGEPLAVIIGSQDILLEVASVLQADHQRKTAPKEEVRIPAPPVTVAAPKKKGFFQRLFG